LDSNLSLKLGDHALSRDLFSEDYACLANNENKPIKWMALESINNNIYNVKTDLWSCGVVIWEIFKFASQPYEEIDAFELADYLMENDKNRLDKPANCPSELFEIYSKCWNTSSSLRPTLKELFYSIHKFYTALNNNYV
jgi:RYK receptor-like tyrosine kinase